MQFNPRDNGADMKVEKTQVQVEKTVTVTETVYILSLTREEAEFMRKFVGSTSAHMASEAIGLCNCDLTMDQMGKILSAIYSGLGNIL